MLPWALRVIFYFPWSSVLTFTELSSAYPTPAPQKVDKEQQRLEEEKQQLVEEKRTAAALLLAKVTKPAAPKVLQGWGFCDVKYRMIGPGLWLHQPQRGAGLGC